MISCLIMTRWWLLCAVLALAAACDDEVAGDDTSTSSANGGSTATSGPSGTTASTGAGANVGVSCGEPETHTGEATYYDFADGSGANEREEKGTRIAIRRQSAFDQPASSAPRRKLSPRVACKDTERRVRILTGRKQWCADYRRALEAYRAGDKAVLFPFGTYLLRVDTHVPTCDGPGTLVPPYAASLRAA